MRSDDWMRRAGPFQVSVSTHRAGTDIPPHAHEEGFLHFVLSGAYEERIGRRAFAVRPQSVLYKPPLCEHSNRFDHGGACTLRVGFDARVCADADWLRCEASELPSPKLATLAQRLRAECARADGLTDLCVEGLCWLLVGEAGREIERVTTRRRRLAEAGRVSRAARRAEELLRARFTSPLTFAEIARELDESPPALARAFRQSYGRTMGEFVRELRVAHVAQQLAATDAPIARIAAAAGFADQSHCCRVFKGAMGLTPRAFRADARRG